MTKKTTLHNFSHATDKSYIHSYIHFYESILRPIRKACTDVLEIGVHAGGSLKMWRDYFTNAQIYGLDVINGCNAMSGEERITYIEKDAYSHQTISELGDRRFDFIIDDGPHTFESQLFVASHYHTLLKPKGVLVIEDIPNQDWMRPLIEAVPERLRPYAYGVDCRWIPNASIINDELIFVLDMRYV